MDRRKIGSLDVSVVGIGTNSFGGRLSKELTSKVLDSALDADINFIDTADVYNGTAAEICIGDWLARRRRDEVVVGTKFGIRFDDQHTGGASKEYVRESAVRSLRRLRTHYIDLFMVHRPDPATPIRETMMALAELVKEGLVREIGCSGFSSAQVDEATEAARAEGLRLVNLQSEYNLLQRSVETEILPLCGRLGVGFVAYRPLAYGFLTGKYRRGQGPPSGARLTSMPEQQRSVVLNTHNFDIVEKLIELAEERGHTILELALSSLLSRPEVSAVIAGAMSAEQVAANALAVGWKLAPETVLEVDRILALPSAIE